MPLQRGGRKIRQEIWMLYQFHGHLLNKQARKDVEDYLNRMPHVYSRQNLWYRFQALRKREKQFGGVI